MADGKRNGVPRERGKKPWWHGNQDREEALCELREYQESSSAWRRERERQEKKTWEEKKGGTGRREAEEPASGLVGSVQAVMSQ